MKVALIVEGKTEAVFLEPLRRFLAARLPDQKKPRISVNKYDGLIRKIDLQRRVKRLLDENDAVIALTDVYTGTRAFVDAADAKRKMREWVGPEQRFYPHAAQYDFEAWLLPYWDDIQQLTGSNRSAPAQNPESVNHMSPPAHRIAEVFRTGEKTKRTFYNKPRDAKRILEGKDLSVAAAQCAQLKALLNTLLTLCGGDVLE